jgi:hypothetical protein
LLLGDDWLTGMNESGRRLDRPATQITQYHAADIGASKLNFETRQASPPVPPAMLLCPGLLGERGEGKMSRSLRCIPLIVALMLIYGTATAKDYRWSCTYSDKASPAGIETEAHLQLIFAFDDVTRKAMVFGTNGSDVDVHMGSLAISFMEKLETGAVQTTVISFAGDSTHSRHTLLSDKDLVPSQYYGQCTKE